MGEGVQKFLGLMGFKHPRSLEAAFSGSFRAEFPASALLTFSAHSSLSWGGRPVCCSRILRSIAEPYTQAARSCDNQHVSRHLSGAPCGEWPPIEIHWFRLDVVG